MKEKKNILVYFHEDTDEGTRAAMNSDLSHAEQKEFDLLKLIWDESANLQNEMAFNAGNAWEAVDLKTANPEKAPSLQVAAKQTDVEQPDRAAKGRIIPLRRYAVAAAAVLVLLVASRFLLQESTVMATSSSPDLKTFVSLTDAREYAFDKMYPLAEYLLLQAESDDFENRVYAMAGERFDGETNVLIQDILGEDSKKKQWKEVLASFKNVNGNNYYPQIFIPDYYDYQTKDGSPVVVFYLSDTPGRNGYVYTGYQIRDGKLKPIGPVDEERLQSLKVWVMSINENVDNNGRIFDAGIIAVDNVAGNGGMIDKMAIYDPKESWAGGASEVRVRAYLETWDGISQDGHGEQIKTLRSTPSPAGVPLRNFSREEVTNRQMVEVDYPLLDGWNSSEFMSDSGVQLVYVIFEGDTWPNTVSEASYSLANGDPRMFKYMSAQEYYDVGCVFKMKSPANWRSPAYPSGIQDSQLISNYTRQMPGIYIKTDAY